MVNLYIFVQNTREWKVSAKSDFDRSGGGGGGDYKIWTMCQNVLPLTPDHKINTEYRLILIQTEENF